MNAQALRQKFAGKREMVAVASGDAVAGMPARVRDAAVLVPIVDYPARLSVLFTRRTDHLHAHAGQISFPGGAAEPSDDSAEATALRETREEIGLDERHIEILGRLPEYRTVTGFRVTPVVSIVRPPFDLSPDRFEVAEVFEVPLDFLLDPVNHRREVMIREGKRRDYYSMPFGHYYIWGATAGMLMNLYAFLKE